MSLRSVPQVVTVLGFHDDKKSFLMPYLGSSLSKGGDWHLGSFADIATALKKFMKEAFSTEIYDLQISYRPLAATCFILLILAWL